jgi:hypothetical protein
VREANHWKKKFDSKLNPKRPMQLSVLTRSYPKDLNVIRYPMPFPLNRQGRCFWPPARFDLSPTAKRAVRKIV